PHPSLSRRERQIMEIIYRSRQATAFEVLEAMPDPPSYSAVRALLCLLEEKGHLKHTKAGRKYIYSPTITTSMAKRSALRNLLNTFFNDSVEQAVASLLDLKTPKLSESDLDRLSNLIHEAREKGRKK
ncbi:MAG: BlaI/MecI/CopY family transcriptional regulator, partial [Planctomycetota bacterium]